DNALYETGYAIEVLGSDGETWVRVAELPANATTWTSGTLELGATYVYCVVAIAENAESFSEAISLETGALPTAPDALTATVNASSAPTATLLWRDNADNETGYIVEVQNADGAWTRVAELPANSTTWTSETLAMNATYVYRILAANEFGYSASLSVEAVVGGTPNAPSDFTFGTYNAVKKTLRTFWADNSDDETRFRVEYSVDGSDWRLAANLGANKISRIATSVQANRLYSFRVRAENAYGVSIWSEATYATAPAAPSDLKAATENHGAPTATLTWVDNALYETGYAIEVLDSDGAWTRVAELPANSTSWTSGTLELGATYIYCVVATTESAETVSEAVAVEIASFPGDLAAVVDASSAPTAFLTWSDNSNDESGYVVETLASDGETWLRVAELPANSTSWTSGTLKLGGIYVYRVAALTASGTAYSESVEFAVGNVPEAPNEFVFATYDSVKKTLQMAWTDNSDDETRFRIEYSANGGAWTLATELGTNGTDYVATSVAENSLYSFRVRAENDYGVSTWSEGGFATLPAAASKLSAVVNASSAPAATLTWVDNARYETGYAIEALGSDGETWTRVAELPANSTSWTSGTLEFGGTYVYRVAASTAGGTAYSESVEVKVEIPEKPALVVTTNLDVVNENDGVLSLREAIQESELGGVIKFDASLKGKTIALSGSELTITKSVTIDASALYDAENNVPGITVNAGDKSRVFNVSGGTEEAPVELIGLTITGGFAGEYNQGGGVYAAGSTLFMNCSIVGNEAGDGAGGALITGDYDDYACFINCLIADNTAGNFGGGVGATEQVAATFVNCVITGNTSNNNNYNNGGGGGVYVGAYDSWSWNSSRADFINCTIAGNEANGYDYNHYSDGDGGGVYVNNGCNASFINSIIVSNGDSSVSNYADWDWGEFAEICSYNSITDGYVRWSNTWEAPQYDYDSSQPLFKDAANGDYTLAENSQAIDKGDDSFVHYYDYSENKSVEPTTDFAGNVRFQGARVDVGAYEFGTRSVPTAPTNLTAEVDAIARTIAVSWTDVATNEIEYVIQVSDDGGATWSAELTLKRNATTTGFSDLIAGTTYLYRIAARNVHGQSAWASFAVEMPELGEIPSTLVTSELDVVDENDGVISLREAIMYRESYPELGATITFAPSLKGKTIALNGTEIAIAQGITIDASNLYDAENDAPGLTVDANEQSRVFNVNGVTEDAPFALIGLAITGGTTTGNGGGVCVNLSAKASTRFEKCVFVENTAGNGGGVYTAWANNATASYKACRFLNNATTSYGGGVYDMTTAAFEDCAFSGNVASKYSGGGVYASTASFENCEIFGNTAADDGGGVHVSIGSFVNCEIFGNTSSSDGGGIYARTGSFANCEISGNTASSGGGVYASTASFVACTVAGNAATQGGGGVCISKSTLRNTILASNFGGDFAGNFDATQESRNNLIGFDPKFVVGPVFDAEGVLTNADALDLRLTAASWAIDRGDNGVVVDVATDFAGASRVVAAWASTPTVDIGAYEYQNVVAKPDMETPATVVTTRDDVVDPTDGKISLREAIIYAEIFESLGATITFAPSLKGTTISLASSLIVTKAGTTIDASSLYDVTNDAPGLTLDGRGENGVLIIGGAKEGAAISLNGLTITGGSGVNGGGVNASGNLEMANCRVVGNAASTYGGGVYLSGGASTFTNCAISDNTISNAGAHADGYGGGVYIFGGASTFTNCAISGNAISSAGDHAHSRGGGVYISGASAFTNCAISGNTISCAGNYAYDDGGGVYVSDGSSTFTNCAISDNTASSGGGVYVSGGSPTFTNCAISDNTASVGGGVYVSYGSSTFTNCAISGNTASSYGGVYIPEGGETTTFVNVSIVGNAGGGVYVGYCYDYQYSEMPQVAFYNSIVLLNDGEDLYVDNEYYDMYSYPATVDAYNTLSSFTEWTNGDGNYVYNVSQPLFKDASNGDYALAKNSQAINKGRNFYVNSETDLAGNPRFVGTVDLGAYEYAAGDVSPLAVPSLEAKSAGSAALILTIGASTNAAAYLVQASTVANFATSTTYRFASAGAQTLADLKANTKYYFRVKALCDGMTALDSDWSTIISATTEKKPQDEASLTVTTAIDVVDATDGVVSLREAIQSATLGATITFDASLKGQTVALAGTELAITQGITIDASALCDAESGVPGLTIDAGGKSRVFNVSGGTAANPVELIGLTITGGNVTGTGGGVYAKGVFALTNSTVSNNTASSNGGGVYVYGTSTFTNATISNNTASSNGGGVYVYKTSTFYNSIVALNTANNNGGDIYRPWNDVRAIGVCVLSSFTAWSAGGNNYVYDETLPLFTDAANGDYTLAENSQAIDKGADCYSFDANNIPFLTDLADGPRFVGTVDLGAYEYAPLLQTSGDSRAALAYRSLDDLDAAGEFELAQIEFIGATTSGPQSVADADVLSEAFADIFAADDEEDDFWFELEKALGKRVK
ncbi:MAG: fibronectin type III domain-containing protein, partial [Thermoguttaceae bacterium]|nr:fibronectin type III domain-containing protein [Thermoguttaceae bacterium]